MSGKAQDRLVSRMVENALGSGPGVVQMGLGGDDRGLPHAEGVGYRLLDEAGLLRRDWQLRSARDVECRAGNSTAEANAMRSCLSCLGTPCCVPCIAGCWMKQAEVSAGNVVAIEDGWGGFDFLGQGVHFYCDLFMRMKGEYALEAGRTDLHIKNGDCHIVEVDQGFVGLAWDMGQPFLLPPGVHQWKSQTMSLSRCVDISQHVAELGPYTLLTVDNGYDAITQNNGKQIILPGGTMHLLNHRNWKFEAFLTKKIQTHDLPTQLAVTADNVQLTVNGTVCWHVTDTRKCAERAAFTQTSQSAIMERLLADVKKQAQASLAMYIGAMRFSGDGSTALSVAASEDSRFQSAVQHANEITELYGVEILSINIISAVPDRRMAEALSQGAVGAAEAQQMERAARGLAKGWLIEAQGVAESVTIAARADADATISRAAGALKAAEELSRNQVSVHLAKIRAQGAALENAGSSLILGKGGGLGNMVTAHPQKVQQLARQVTTR